MDQYSPTHFKQFGYVLQNAKQMESYTGHGTHLKDMAFGLCPLTHVTQTVDEHYSTTACDSC